MQLQALVASAQAWLFYQQQQITTKEFVILATSVFGLSSIYLVLRRRQSREKQIPGPFLPLSLNSNEVDVRKMQKLIDKYGPIFCMRIFNFRMVFLCNVDLIKEALVGQAETFSGRLEVTVLRYTNKQHGIMFVDGPKWQEHRRFVLTVLRSFGFGKNLTERIIQDELELLCEQIAANYREPINTQPFLVKSVANVICLLVFGERCSEEPGFKALVRGSVAATSVQVKDFFVEMFPSWFLLNFPFDFTGLKKYIAEDTLVAEYIKNKIQEHRNTIDWNSERDLIDAYLIEMRKREQESPGEHTFTEYQLIRVAFELFIAGIETTTTTMRWVLLLMAKHPKIQERVFQEIQDVIGDKVPQYADRTKLVYTTAVMHEIERYVSLTPFIIFRRVLQDTKVAGYSLPENSVVLPYAFGAHHDPNVWKYPHEFNPSNFYDEASKSLINVNNLVPFGIGKRSCLGEALASQQLFVLFVGLVQRFKWEGDVKYPLPEIEAGVMGIPFRFPPEHEVIPILRSNI